MKTIPWQSMNTREIRRRLFAAVPSGSPALRTLLGLVELRLDRSIPTACIHGRLRPRLLVNPDFLARHCRTEAHLYMLVMHELMHITLGHTRLFPRPDALANIAFDAVINAVLCHGNHGPEYTSFLTGLYSEDRYPDCLLRPPSGFPDHDARGPASGRSAYHSVALLYCSEHRVTMSYHELFIKLERTLRRESPGKPPLLLGDHESGMAARYPRRSNPGRIAVTLESLVSGRGRKVAREADLDVSKLVFDFYAGRGGALQQMRVRPQSAPGLAKMIGAMVGRLAQSAVRLCSGPDGCNPVVQQGVIPDWRDRSAGAQEMLLKLPKVLWNNTQASRALPVTRVYLDVSGSMEDKLPQLFGALCHLAKVGLQLECFGFSTEVHPISSTDLHSGFYLSTEGTDIECVLGHHFIERDDSGGGMALVLTDGELNRSIHDIGGLRILRV